MNFLPDNVASQVSKKGKSLKSLVWDILVHPPCSPDLTPSDYDLLTLMTHVPATQYSSSSEWAGKWLDELLAEKKKVWKCIHNLPVRWANSVQVDFLNLEKRKLIFLWKYLFVSTTNSDKNYALNRSWKLVVISTNRLMHFLFNNGTSVHMDIFIVSASCSAFFKSFDFCYLYMLWT